MSSATETTLSELYLVLHKVRGEPAFDVAQKLQIGNEEGWIIPTSGHRCYPYQVFSMTQMWYQRDFVPTLVDTPNDLPDHYQIHTDVEKYGGKVKQLLSKLGL